MKNSILCLLAAVLALPLLLSSCKSDEEEIVYSDQCYISAFSLGSLKMTHYVKGRDGKDSSYTTVFAGSAFPMTIQQRPVFDAALGEDVCLIENKDSLPLHTRVDRLLVTASFTSALVWRKHPKYAEPADTVWKAFSQKDSLDFTTPLQFAAVANNGKNLRTYLVKLNVHQQRGDTTVWTREEALPAAPVMARKAVALGGTLVVLSVDDAGRLAYAVRAAKHGAAWATGTTGVVGALPATVQKQGDKLLMTTADGKVLQSTDGIAWSAAGYPQQDGLQLIAASDARLYAKTAEGIVSSDGGAWAMESLDADGALLPQKEMQSVAYTMADGQQRLMLFGQAGERTVTWAKAWTKGEETTESWMYYTSNGSDRYALPVMDRLNVLTYDNGLVALDGTLQRVVKSVDHGITWKAYDNNDLNIDDAILAAAQEATQVTAAVDADQYLWLVVDNQVWRGRINRLGFLRQDK